MTKIFRWAALAAGLTLLASASVLSAPQETRYETALTALYGSNAPYVGTLKLTVSSRGLVHGYYSPSDGSALFIPVTGAEIGSKIWFDIGNDGMYHVNAHIHNGIIDGTALTPAQKQYAFVAKPQE